MGAVISPVKKERGRKVFYLCLNGRRIECTLLDRMRSESNAILDTLIKGDHIIMKGFEKRDEGHYVANQETVIERVC